MDYNRLHRRDEFARDNEMRREFDQATPSVGPAGLIVGAVILLILGIIYFVPPAGERPQVAAGDSVEATAPMPHNNQ